MRPHPRPFIFALLLAVACATVTPRSPVALTGCRQGPTPVPTVVADAGVYAPTGGWLQRVGQVLGYLEAGPNRPGAVDAAIIVVRLYPMQPADRVDALRWLTELRDTALPDLRRSHDLAIANDPSGRCRANLAARAVATALRGFAVAIARSMHWDVTDEIRFALNLVGPITDELNPSCATDAGWSRESNDIQRALAARASPLRRFPTADEAQRAADRSRQ
jgi:hypothetical protein